MDGAAVTTAPAPPRGVFRSTATSATAPVVRRASAFDRFRCPCRSAASLRGRPEGGMCPMLRLPHPDPPHKGGGSRLQLMVRKATTGESGGPSQVARVRWPRVRLSSPDAIFPCRCGEGIGRGLGGAAWPVSRQPPPRPSPQGGREKAARLHRRLCHAKPARAWLGTDRKVALQADEHVVRLCPCQRLGGADPVGIAEIHAPVRRQIAAVRGPDAGVGVIVAGA